jgi:uncharacterized membrane protein
VTTGILASLPLALDSYVTSWLDLLLRWLHVIAAIAWVGASFYFVLLDQSLRFPKDVADREAGVGGELWEVHGGGFYHVQKYRVAPQELPDHLAWFKWEAYTTWLSGFALMVVLYYLNAGTYLVDRSVADLDDWQAVAISAAMLAGAWVVYDVLCRILGDRELVLGACILGLTALAAWGAGELFAPRAAYLQVGAMLGTAMAGNVFFNIIPAHWELIRAKQAGRDPDPAPGIDAKRRSVHNNYLTLPVLFTMLAGHFSFTYGADHAWLVLLALMLLGAWARLFFNLRHQGRTMWSMPAVGIAALVGLAFWLQPDNGSSSNTGTVAFPRVQSIVSARCATCHSLHPSQPGFSSPPAGVVLESPTQISAQASRIRAVVEAKVMPLGNLTHMTDEERQEVVAWVDQGAKTAAR